MKKQLLSLTRLKHFRNLCYSLCFLLVCVNVGWGQTQTLGSFPYMDGGFEGQTATLAGTAISGTLSTAAWSVSSSTKSTTKLVILDASAARSGSKYAAHTTSDVTIRLQSPSTATESAAPAVSTQYTVQYYFKTTTDPLTGLNRGGIYNDAVNGNSTITVSTIVGAWSSNVWTKAYSTITTAAGRTTPYAATGYGAVRTAIASSNLYDDFVIYPGAYDNQAPANAPSATAAIASATTFNIGWTASTDADKTGYMVVRYASDPSTNNLAVPNVNGIYAVGNTILNGSATGTVAYIGGTEATSFTDTVADTGVQTYYRIFTIDKAFNYSLTPLDLTTVVDNTAPGNPGAVTVSGATATTLSPSWEAASSIDGGGYLVVRYATSPNADNDPTQKTTYVVGNTYTNGTDGLTGTVVYVGTGLLTTDTGLTTDVTYYYKVYTFDQAKNYSGESSGSGTPTSAEDNTAPNAPGTASISNQTTTTLTTNWLAAPGGVDGGGYMVVRYSGDPSPETGADPVQKATYAVDDTYATGTNPDGITPPKNARVVYIGTDLTCITTGLTPSDYTYYKVYTFDAAKNYSGASFVKGKTSYQFVTPTALAATVPAADGFTANWNLLDNSLTPTAAIYTVNTYSVASTASIFVGWTIPAAVADTASLIADVTTANNTTKALTIFAGGTITTTGVTGNPGVAARGSSWYSTNLISGTEITTDDADPLLVAVYAEPKAAPDRYWQVEVNTVGYINPTISSHQYSTATGPKDFKLQYSSTGTSGTFEDLVSTITLGSGVWNTTAVADVALPVSCHNNPNVVLRWKQTSFTNTNNVEMTTPSTGGTSRIDNILLKGLKLTVANTTASTSTTNTSIPVTGLATGSYYYDVVASKNSTTDLATGVVTTYVASPNSNLISVAVTTPQNVANYRSTTSGTISSTSIWQYFDATTWQTATEAPTSANSITIQAGHTITLDANFVFNTGKSLTISGTLDLAGFNVSGAGATVTSNSGSKVILGNNVSLASGITTATVSLSTATNFDFNGTSVAQHTGGLPGSSITTSNANGSQNYTTTLTGNITVSNPEGVTMNQTIKLNTPGILTVTSTGKFLFGDGNVASGAIAAGTYNSGTYNLTGTGSFVAQSDCTLVITSSKGISGISDGNIRSSTARTFGSGINFVFAKNDGVNPISIGTSFYNGDINPATGIKNMTIDCPYGVYFASTFTGTPNTNASGFVTTLTYTGGNDITVNGALNFVSGKLYTGDYVTVATNSVPIVVVNSSNYYPVVSLVITPGNTSALKLNVGQSGSITGAGSGTGWVVGNLKKLTALSASPSFTYAIGDATNYTPLALTFSGNTSAAGSLTASTASGEHASIATSGIDATKSLNRTWTLTNDALADFGTYSAAFGYASTDNDAGTTPAGYITRLYNGSTWSALTSSGTSTDTAATATGISAFGDFAIGEASPLVAPVVVATVNVCLKATAPVLTATAFPGNTLRWYKDNVTTTFTTTAPALTTTAAGTKTYYVAQVSGASVSAKSLITVNVLALADNVSTLITSDAVLCKFIGNTNTVVYTAGYAVGTGVSTTSYAWTKPVGVTIIGLDNGPTLTVDFSDATKGLGLATLGTITVKGVTANQCSSLVAKSITLATKLPTAPTSLVMTSLDETEHFKGLVSAADATTVPPTPAVYGLFGLNTLTAGIKKVGPYMDTATEFILTAPAAVTAASYLWTLPSGVNPTGSSALTNGQPNQFTSAGSVITANFADVTPGTTALPIVVQSVGGCGNSTNRTLSLARTVPTAPTALVLTNTTQANLIPLAKITKVGPYTGTNIDFTLTATPFTTQGATATSYAWVLPAGVVCTTCAAIPDTTVKVKSTVNTGTTEAPIYVIDDVDAFSSATSTITVKFSGAATKTTGDLLLSVYAVNGTGNSVARTLKLARALPTAPTKLVLTDATTTVVAKAGVYAGKETPLTLTATPFLVQGAEATSYKWILPEGVTVTTGATEEADEIVGTRTWTGTDTVLTVNLELITTVMQLPMTVHAVNGAGTSLPKALTTVATALPSPVAAVAGSLNVCNREEGFVYTITAPFGANKYLITAPAGSVVSSTNGIATAVGGSLTNNELTTTDLTFKVVYSGTTAFLTTDKALKIQAGNATGFLTTAKSLTLVRKTTCVGLRAIDASVADEFSVTAYPNPSSSDFTIQASRKGATVKVYDMMGRLIENRQATSNTVQVGSRLAAGAYNVIVKQGANTKTLKVIKK